MNENKFETVVIQLLTDLSGQVKILSQQVADLVKRVDALEVDVKNLRIEMHQEFAAVRKEMKEADSALQAHIHTLSFETKKGFARADARMDEGFAMTTARMDKGFAMTTARMDEGFARMDEGFARADDRMDALYEKAKRRQDEMGHTILEAISDPFGRLEDTTGRHFKKHGQRILRLERHTGLA